MQYWALPEFLCKAAPFASELSYSVSIFTLVAMSINRYHIIFHPFKAKLSRKQCLTIFSLIWIMSLSISSIHLYNYNVKKVNLTKSNDIVQVSRCIIKSSLLFEYHRISLVIVQYVVPLIILCFTYSCIGWHIYWKRPTGFMKRTNQVFYSFEKNRRKVLILKI